MINLLLFDPAESCYQTGDESLLYSWRASQASIIWVDLCDATIREEQSFLNQKLSLPMAAVRGFQCLQGPALEQRGDYVLLRLNELATDEEQWLFSLRALGFFFTQRCLITRHAQPSSSVSLLWDEMQHHPLAEFLPSIVAVRLVNMITARYLSFLSATEVHMDTLEEQQMGQTKSAESQEELILHRSKLDLVRKEIELHYELFTTLNTLDLELGDEVNNRLLVLQNLLRQGLLIAERYSHEFIQK